MKRARPQAVGREQPLRQRAGGRSRLAQHERTLRHLRERNVALARERVVVRGHHHERIGRHPLPHHRHAGRQRGDQREVVAAAGDALGKLRVIADRERHLDVGMAVGKARELACDEPLARAARGDREAPAVRLAQAREIALQRLQHAEELRAARAGGGLPR